MLCKQSSLFVSALHSLLSAFFVYICQNYLYLARLYIRYSLSTQNFSRLILHISNSNEKNEFEREFLIITFFRNLLS